VKTIVVLRLGLSGTGVIIAKFTSDQLDDLDGYLEIYVDEGPEDEEDEDEDSECEPQ
jgi:hypothetical protein